MFTGIITHLGIIIEKTDTTLTIESPTDIRKQMTLGMSVAVDGICLTVTALPSPEKFMIEFMPETAYKTNIQSFRPQTLVNLELPVKVDTLFAGHIVQGHIDTTACIATIVPDGNSHIFTFDIDPTYIVYMVPKGSIAVNGISLTIVDVHANSFSVGIIPHTWQHTMLHTAQKGDYVNIEVDIIAKHVYTMLQRTHVLPSLSLH